MTFNIDSDIVYVCGDIHQEFSILNNTLEKYEIKDSSIIILGDCGLGHYDTKSKWETKKFFSKLQKFDEQLKVNNNKVYFIRGNHDNPSFWQENTYENIKSKNMLTNIIIVPDFSTIIIKDEKFIVIGGSISLDRFQRTKDISYWEDEKINYEQLSKWHEEDYYGVLSHCGPKPIYCWKNDNNPVFNFFLTNDESLKDELNEEQESIINFLNNNQQLKVWYYGHYHLNEMNTINDTDLFCLNCHVLKDISYDL